jgi:hypothetical protein
MLGLAEPKLLPNIQVSRNHSAARGVNLPALASIYMNGKDLFNFGPAFGYFFRKNDPSRKTNFNLRTMHFINKLSMAMFLVGLGVLLYRWFIR